MTENQRFSVDIILDESPKRISVSAPINLKPRNIAVAVKRFSKDKEVGQEFKQLDENSTVEVVVYENLIIGISINN